MQQYTFDRTQKWEAGPLRRGDIVYCQMPLSPEELEAIPEGHRKRPYLVLKTLEDGFWGVPASHKLCTATPAWTQIQVLASRLVYHSQKRYTRACEKGDSFWFNISSFCFVPHSCCIRSYSMIDRGLLPDFDRILAVLRPGKSRYIPHPGDILDLNGRKWLITGGTLDKAAAYCLMPEPVSGAVTVTLMDGTRMHYVPQRKFQLRYIRNLKISGWVRGGQWTTFHSPVPSSALFRKSREDYAYLYSHAGEDYFYGLGSRQVYSGNLSTMQDLNCCLGALEFRSVLHDIWMTRKCTVGEIDRMWENSFF